MWISLLGRTYHSRPQPISIDLPDPLPRPEQYPDHPSSDTADEGPILERPPPEPGPPPPERADEPPPF